MIGHQKIIQDLRTLSDRGALGHGYIFYGPAMVGKKLAALDLAHYLEGGAKVLSEMSLIAPGEANSIGIGAIREIKEFLWQKPNASSRRTLIIDDAELLTTEAQNALLKITEEPPESSLLILITSDADSILPTMLSRLPKIYFAAVPEKEIAAWLSGERLIPKAKADALAKQSFGKPGLARRLSEDEGFQEQLELAEKLLKTPAAGRRDIIKKIIEPESFNFRKFLDAVIMNLAWRGIERKNAALWHKALSLYDRESNFNLSPRLQLENLLL